MVRFIARRLLLIPLALVLINMGSYAYAYLVRPLQFSRNPYSSLLSQAGPLGPDYLAYAGQAIQGNFGVMPNNQPIPAAVWQTSAASMGLIGLALGLSVLVGISLGLRAVRPEPPAVAQWLMLISTMGLAAPSFYVAILLITAAVLFLLWGPLPEPLLPFQGFGWDAHLILPTLALAVQPTVKMARVTAGLLVDELHKPYVLAARSVGYSWPSILGRQAFRNIIAAVIVTTSSSLRLLLAELIVVERLFSWPGLGRMLSQVLIVGAGELYLNPPVLAFVLMVLAGFLLAIDLIAAILARSFDPRLREV